nr:ABC transporter substrate-binding protein [Pleionea sp. CnH1-48]
MANDKDSRAIVIAENDWSSQIILSHIAGILLEREGYQVAYRPTGTAHQFKAIARGLIDIQVEVWPGILNKDFEQLVSSGNLIDAGTHDAKTREEWWYPLYVKELCPGLPDWQALKDCDDLFMTPETAPKGRFLGGPWNRLDQKRLDALNLNYTIIHAPHASTLWSELAAAYAQKTPIILYNWQPNSMQAVYEGEFVEFPEHHPECNTQPEYGADPQQFFDCGNPKHGILKKAVSLDLLKQWPCAAEMIRRFNFDNRSIAELSHQMDALGFTRKEVAHNWINHNESVWQQWLPDKCQQQVKQ